MKRSKQWEDTVTRLVNYKVQQEEVAKMKGVWEQFAAATTLTQARKILWGMK